MSEQPLTNVLTTFFATVLALAGALEEKATKVAEEAIKEVEAFLAEK